MTTKTKKRPLILIEGRLIGRVDNELVQRVREARIRQGSELVSINGRARFIDPAEAQIAA